MLASATLTPGRRRAAFLCGLILFALTAGLLVWRVGEMLHHPSRMIAAPIEPNQTGRYLSARIAHNSGQLRDSLHFTEDALKHEPDNGRLMLYGYRTALFAGDYERLIGYAKKLPADAEPGLPPTFVLAMNELRNKDYAGARKDLLAMPPKGFSAAFQPLMLLWAEAGAGTLKQPAQVPAFAAQAGELALLMTFHVALINEAAGFEEAAKQNYATLQKGSELLPNRVAQGLVNYLQRTGRGPEAEATVAAHRGTHPDAPLRVESVTGTQSVAPMVKSVNEGVAELLYGMASIYVGMQAQAEAVAHLRLALMLRPDMDVAHYMLGMLQEQGKHPDDAIASYRAISERDPVYRRAQLRIALVHYARGQKKEAFAQLDTLQKSDAHAYDALLARGDLLRDDQDFRNAATAYTQALARVAEPKAEHWHIFYARGISYERANQWPKAEADLLRALALRPNQPEVMNYLAYSWLVHGLNQAKAKTMLTEALAQQPENPAIIDSYGWAYYLEGDYKQALFYIEQALDMMPKDATVNDHLGDIYWRLERETEARYQWERALLFKPEEAGQKAAIQKKIEQGLPPLAATPATNSSPAEAASTAAVPRAIPASAPDSPPDATPDAAPHSAPHSTPDANGGAAQP